MKKVLIEDKKNVFEDFFKLEEAHLRFEKFNGEMSAVVRRLSLERGDSVAILVFNLTTSKLILINQFRYSTYKNGQGWLIETMAGMIDHDEKPEDAARREVNEEIGLSISALDYISTFYLSPGGSSERIHLYYSEVSGENAKYEEVGGLISEGEDIKVEEMSLDEALLKIRSGEIVDAKTIIGIYWLENRQLKK
jgi:nudix-type nucleoside diphosphatase (YffH/AdpP family)